MFKARLYLPRMATNRDQSPTMPAQTPEPSPGLGEPCTIFRLTPLNTALPLPHSPLLLYTCAQSCQHTFYWLLQLEEIPSLPPQGRLLLEVLDRGCKASTVRERRLPPAGADLSRCRQKLQVQVDLGSREAATPRQRGAVSHGQGLQFHPGTIRGAENGRGFACGSY